MAEKTDSLRVGVSGVGGGRGQSIMKCLFQSKLPVEVYPADVTPFAAGLYRSRHAGVILPKPEESIEEWLRWAEANRLQAILPGSDYDLLPFSEHHAEFATRGCFVVVSRPEAIRISNSKRRTMEALRDVGLDYPHSVGFAAQMDYGNTQFTYPDKYPVVVKPDFSMTSRGLHIAHDDEELLFYWKRVENPAIQEYLEGDEFTCSVFIDKFGFVSGCFVMKRELYAGTTFRAEINEFPELKDYLIREWGPKMAPYGFVGPINIQLKDVPNRGYVTFEINAACSGSTAIRASFDYNEPEKALRHFVLFEKSLMNSAQPRGYAMRYWDEMIFTGVTKEDIEQQKEGLKAVIPSWL